MAQHDMNPTYEYKLPPLLLMDFRLILDKRWIAFSNLQSMQNGLFFHFIINAPIYNLHFNSISSYLFKFLYCLDGERFLLAFTYLIFQIQFSLNSLSLLYLN